MVNRRLIGWLNDKLLASFAKILQSMIFTPKFNTFANGKSMNCGFIAILANNLLFNQPINHWLTVD